MLRGSVLYSSITVGGINMIENLTNKIADSWNKRLQLSELDFIKMKFGLEVILINVTKLIIIISLGFIVGTGVETILICILSAMLRINTFGEHAKSSIVCTLISCVTHVGIPCLTMNFALNHIVYLALAFIMICFIYRYAPADTEKHPLIGAEKRKKLKHHAVITAVIIVLAALVIPYNRMAMLVLLSLSYIVIAILPITYKLLRRKQNNYEEYE